MHDWVFWAMDKVEERAKQDPVFCKLAQRHEALVHDFEALVDSLGMQERELLLDYMDAAGDLDYRRCQIAFELGRSNPK